MNVLLVLVLVALMGMVVLSLVRGIVAFMQSTREDLENHAGTGPSPMQLKQNQLMFKRILYQGAAILVVAVLLFANR